MNRELIKKAIKKIVLQEITKSDYGVGKVGTQKDVVKKIQTTVGKNMEVSENPLNGKVVVDDSNGGIKFQCEISECGDGLYDVVVVKNGSDRKVGKQIDMDKLLEFLKETVKEEKSYKEKSFDKGNPNRKKTDKKEEKKSDEDSGEMKEVEVNTQKDISDDNDSKAEEKADKELSPVSKDASIAPMGGELVDKIEKIIDAVLKNKVKADAKTPYLKADEDKESPDKLTVKVKDTPSLNEGYLGSPKYSGPVFVVHIPANVYNGKYYDYQTYQIRIPKAGNIKTEQDAIQWVNSHKDLVLKKADMARDHSGRRRVKMPSKDNVFFNDKYYVRQSEVYHI